MRIRFFNRYRLINRFPASSHVLQDRAGCTAPSRPVKTHLRPYYYVKTHLGPAHLICPFQSWVLVSSAQLTTPTCLTRRIPIPTVDHRASSSPQPAPAAAMWRGGATAASAARALRSRLLLEPIHHPVTSLAPIASARTSSSSSAPSTATANTIVEEAAAVSVSQHAGSISDALRQYGKCYWELSKARLRCAIFSPLAPLTHGSFVTFLGITFEYKLNNTPSFHATADITRIGVASLGLLLLYI